MLQYMCVCSCVCMDACSFVCVSGVFICRGKEDALVTKNLVMGESVYGEKRIGVEVRDELGHKRVFFCFFHTKFDICSFVHFSFRSLSI